MESGWGHGRLPITSCHLAWFHADDYEFCDTLELVDGKQHPVE